MKKIGILGAGQLGCMLAESLFHYGAEVLFYDVDPDAPGRLRTPHFTCGSWTDEDQLTKFFSRCDIVTYEFENISVELLDLLVNKTKIPLCPSARILTITQNRILEKNFLKENKLPVCEYDVIYSHEELALFIEKYAEPCVLKTVTGGYDGKGQWRIDKKEDLELLLSSVDLHFPLIREQLVPIHKEVSCITARNKEGEMVSLPIFENEHRDHILYNTYLPAIISSDLCEKIQAISRLVCEKLNVVGLLTTEFFLTKNEEQIFINEFAPRPHNSGHISRLACNFSQFDLLARVLCDLPLLEPTYFKRNFCMGNLLGDIWINQGATKNLNLDAWKGNPCIQEVVLYGKVCATEKRKMGHFIAVAEDRFNAMDIAEKFRRDLNAFK